MTPGHARRRSPRWTRHSDRCAVELADADCDALAYACLVAVMAAGPGAHAAQRTPADRGRGRATPVVTSAGALVDGIRALGARRVAMITPYAPALTAKVVAYLADAGIEVVDAISLGVTDNRAVGRLDPAALVGLTDRLNLSERRGPGALGVRADAVAAGDRGSDSNAPGCPPCPQPPRPPGSC